MGADVRVVSVSSSRADVGPLSAVWQALDARDVDLHIVLTGMHMAAGAPKAAPIPTRASVHRCGADIGGRADGAAADALGSITTGCGRLYDELRPDAVLVLGDRLDMAPAALATTLFDIPLAHVHGGEITEGAIDDRIRHAVTLLADLHLVSSKAAAERVARMRGRDGGIIITGAPGLDTLLGASVLDRARFLKASGLDRIAGSDRFFRLVTVHPETASGDPLAPLRAVLSALDAHPMPTLLTAPNSDPGGAEMKRIVAEWSAARPWVRSVDTLGSLLYPNALRHADLMIGNSSSGVIEAGLFGLPVVDVGDRQKGRERGRNVISAEPTVAAVLAAMATASRLERIADSRYGDGHAADRIAQALCTRYANGRRSAVA